MKKAAPKGSPLTRNTGYVCETEISGAVTMFSVKRRRLMVLLLCYALFKACKLLELYVAFAQ